MATEATLSFLPALNETLRSGGRSGASAIVALSATCSVTSAWRAAPRGTSSVEPALTSIFGGIWFTSRSAASLMPTCFAASAGLSVFGATQAVQLAVAPRWAARPCRKRFALS